MTVVNLDKSKRTPAPKPPPAKRPPGRPSNASRTQAAQHEAQTRLERRTGAVLGLFNLISMPAMLAGQLADVGAINEHAPKIAQEAANIGEIHERFGETIDKLEVVGPYAGLLLAVAPLVLQLMVNHKRIPESAAGAFGGLGVVSPELLEARMTRTLLEAEQAARAEAEAVQHELAEHRAAAGAGE